MLIRCENCSTVYQLDENVLPASGAPVQCTRCQHVFTAYPPQAAGRTLTSFAPVDASALPDASGASPVPKGGTATFAPPPASAPPPAFSPLPPPPPPKGTLGSFSPLAGTNPRQTAPAIAPAPQPAPAPAATLPATKPAVSAAPARPAPQPHSPATPVRDPRNDTLTRFAAHVRRSQRWKWLGPLIAVGALAIAIGIYRMASSRIDPRAVKKRDRKSVV